MVSCMRRVYDGSPLRRDPCPQWCPFPVQTSTVAGLPSQTVPFATPTRSTPAVLKNVLDLDRVRGKLCTVIAEIFVRVTISNSSVCRLSYARNFRTATVVSDTLVYMYGFRMLLNFVLSAKSTKYTKLNRVQKFVQLHYVQCLSSMTLTKLENRLPWNNLRLLWNILKKEKGQSNLVKTNFKGPAKMVLSLKRVRLIRSMQHAAACRHIGVKILMLQNIAVVFVTLWLGDL